jgi:hypothetical protein
MTKTAAIDPNSPFAMFETNEAVEAAGIRLDYGPFYFQVARAGGANTRFRDVLRDRLRPHRRAMATETMNEDLADRIGREVFAETVVLGWGSEKHGEGFMLDRDGGKIAFSTEAVKELFQRLPELARDVMTQAQSFQLFRTVVAEADAKN